MPPGHIFSDIGIRVKQEITSGFRILDYFAFLGGGGGVAETVM